MFLEVDHLSYVRRDVAFFRFIRTAVLAMLSFRILCSAGSQIHELLLRIIVGMLLKGAALPILSIEVL